MIFIIWIIFRIIVIFVMTISGGLWYVLCILSGMILIREIFQMAASLKRYFFRYFDKDISKIAYIIQNKLVELNLQNWVKNTKIFQTNWQMKCDISTKINHYFLHYFRHVVTFMNPLILGGGGFGVCEET